MACPSSPHAVDFGNVHAGEAGVECVLPSESRDVANNESDDDETEDKVYADIEGEDGKNTATDVEVKDEEEREGREGVRAGLNLKDDPTYEKYYRMMRMGLPKEAVKHAMSRDNLDPRYVALIPR